MSITASGILDQIEKLRARGQEFCVVTVVRTADATSAKAGAKAIVTHDGAILGFIGGACVQGSVRQAATDVLSTGRARLIRVRPKDEVLDIIDTDGTELHPSACPSGGTVELFIEPTLLAPRMIVMGASPVGAALVALAAAMGYRTVVACLAGDKGLVPDADEYVEGFDLGEDVATRSFDAVVVATQGRGDRKALESAVVSPADYIAFVGSHRKAGKLKSDMLEAGHDAVRVEKIKSPAGLDIGAIEPEEIAISIFAEVIRWRRGNLVASGAAESHAPEQAKENA